jgi:hypothetical protein
MVDLHGGPATCKQSLLDSARAGNARTGSRWKTGMSQYCKVFPYSTSDFPDNVRALQTRHRSVAGPEYRLHSVLMVIDPLKQEATYDAQVATEKQKLAVYQYNEVEVGRRRAPRLNLPFVNNSEVISTTNLKW